MISRNGVRGRNFTKRSSFLTSGLQREVASRRDNLKVSPQFQLLERRV